MTVDQKIVHASCVILDGSGILLRGPSGVGKSDLALRLIDQGGMLVSDDQVLLKVTGDRLLGKPVPQLAGLLEVRGIGICQFAYQDRVEITAVFDLLSDETPERLPNHDHLQTTILGVQIACFPLQPFHSSAPAKIRAALGLINASHKR